MDEKGEEGEVYEFEGFGDEEMLEELGLVSWKR